MYDVEAPKKAIAHIQNTAPGPPNAIAVATPAMLPVPTRPASETASAWNEDTPELDDLLLNIRRSISGTPQTCMKRVRIEKYRPRPRHSPTSAMLQMMSLSEFRNASTYRDPSSRSEEHTSELQSLMRNSYAVFCLKQKKQTKIHCNK